MSRISYAEALRDALMIAMEKDPGVFVMGIGADDHKAIFGSVQGLVERFGRGRIFDTPLSEGAMTGVAIGASCARSSVDEYPNERITEVNAHISSSVNCSDCHIWPYITAVKI